MAAKELKFSDDARSRLKEGIDTVADTLKSVSYTHLTLPTNREV